MSVYNDTGSFKQTSSGQTIEIKTTGTGMTGLYVNGQLQDQSHDAGFIKSLYDQRN